MRGDGENVIFTKEGRTQKHGADENVPVDSKKLHVENKRHISRFR